MSSSSSYYNEKDLSPLCIMTLSSTRTDSSSFEYTDRLCRSCLSPKLVVDWAAGDRVCTNCGVVDEEHLRDDGPEWREFNDVDDLAKNRPSAARSGMVPVDESKYLGGLQPTTLSKHVYGGATRGGNDLSRRKSLLATNKKIDHMVEKQHVMALKKAKVSRLARQKSRHSHYSDHGDEASLRPEHDRLLLQEEEDEDRLRTALHAEKWSLDRALLLHGGEMQDGQLATSMLLRHASLTERETEREDLLQRLDKPLQQASLDLFRAYQMLQEAANRLSLPSRVLHKASALMCQYATKRDGLSVRGVSNRVSAAKKNGTNTSKQELLSEYNKLKQMGALGSALLFLTARKLGWTRSLAEVCASLQLGVSDASRIMTAVNEEEERAFIKPKHCSRAMNEIKALFPEFARAASFVATTTAASIHQPGGGTIGVATDKFVEHALQKLELPPVAVASIRMLVSHCQSQQLESGLESGTKLSTLTASICLLVCSAGEILQRLAKQSPDLGDSSGCNRSGKRVFSEVGLDESVEPSAKSSKIDSSTEGDDNNNDGDIRLDPLFDSYTKELVPTGAASESTSFDVFSSQSEKDLSYQSRRVFDAWSEQIPWSRSISRIEQSCGVSRNVIAGHYKSCIYPRRLALLEVLQEASPSVNRKDGALSATPMASVLLSNITVAASLMTISKVKL